MPRITLEQARAAKEAVKKICERLGVDAAVGITCVGDDYAVKVNLSEPPKSDVELPTQVDGVPLKLEVVGTIRPRRPSSTSVAARIAHRMQGAAPVVIGLGAGLIGSLGLGRLIGSLVFGVATSDPMTLSTVAILLMTAAIAAISIPARRATRIDPLIALRNE